MRSILAFLVDIRRLAVPYFMGEDRWPGRALLAAVVLLELASVFLNVQFNEWNARFYNAVQEKNWDIFKNELLYFCGLAALFIIAAVYPTYTYGDDPKKWVADEAASKLLRESTDAHRKTLWAQLEAQARGPWFLGDRFSALDLYIAVMTRWRPGVLWFAKNTPKVVEIAKRATALPAVAPVMKKNFE